MLFARFFAVHTILGTDNEGKRVILKEAYQGGFSGMIVEENMGGGEQWPLLSRYPHGFFGESVV